jgi:hypothetical protein
MTLREDEIEALVKFDRSSLTVVKYDDLTTTAGQPYVAIIKMVDGRAFAGNGDSRITAVRAAWETYQRFMNAPIQSRHNGYWLYENALANVELQRITNQTEKQHG